MDYTEIPPALSNSTAPVFGQSAGCGAQTESRLEVMAGIRWAKVGRRRPGERHSTAPREDAAALRRKRPGLCNLESIFEITIAGTRGRGERGDRRQEHAVLSFLD